MNPKEYYKTEKNWSTWNNPSKGSVPSKKDSCIFGGRIGEEELGRMVVVVRVV